MRVAVVRARGDRVARFLQQEAATAALPQHVLAQPASVDVSRVLREQRLALLEPCRDVAALDRLSRRPRDAPRG